MPDITPSEAEPRFVTDAAGNRVAVLLDVERYRELLDAREELDDIRAYDAAKNAGDEFLPLEEALREIEQARKTS